MIIADSMLGKLARYLRILGYQVVYIPADKGDDYILKEFGGYLLLTRDRELNRKFHNSILINSFLPLEQLKEIKTKLPPPEYGPWRLCPECSSLLERVDGRENLPDYVSKIAKEVFICRNCEKYYWQGSQSINFKRMMEGIGIEI